jgi:hypothetical protein
MERQGGDVLRRVLLVVSVAALVGVAGCKTTPFAAQEKITHLNVITFPRALDLDGRPGPDGISIKVYASAKDIPKPVPLRKGTLEVLMFDGVFQRQGPPPPVLKQFTLTAEELRRAEFTAKIGTGYQLSLPWGTNLPTRQIMSVAARFTDPDGKIAISRPSSISVLAR